MEQDTQFNITKFIIEKMDSKEWGLSPSDKLVLITLSSYFGRSGENKK